MILYIYKRSAIFITVLILLSISFNLYAQDIEFGGVEIDLEDDSTVPQKTIIKKDNDFDVVVLGQPKQKAMETALEEMNDEDYDEAVILFFEVLKDPASVDYHQAAEFYIGRSLVKLKFYYSALKFFSRILHKGNSHKFFNASQQWLFYLAHKIADESLVLKLVGELQQIDVPKKYTNEFNYLLGRHYYFTGKSDNAKEYLKRVNKKSKYYLKSLYLLGVSHYTDYEYQSAVNSLKSIVNILSKKRRLKKREVRLLEMVFMTMGRLHYEAGRYNAAVYYFSKVRRNSMRWFKSLFEAAWADFRRNDDDRSLGSLFTIHSPFFAEEFLPESHILKAVIYFENCRYPEARAIISEFLAVHEPLFKELKRMTQQELKPVEYYQYLLEIQQNDESSNLLKSISSIVTENTDLKRPLEAIKEIQEEKEEILDMGDAFLETPFGSLLVRGIEKELSKLMDRVGTLAYGKLIEERDNLKFLISQSYRINFEVATAEKENLEDSMRGESGKVNLREYSFSKYVEDEEMYWTFDGEYWADELGTYRYTLTKGCK